MFRLNYDPLTILCWILNVIRFGDSNIYKSTHAFASMKTYWNGRWAHIVPINHIQSCKMKSIQYTIVYIYISAFSCVRGLALSLSRCTLSHIQQWLHIIPPAQMHKRSWAIYERAFFANSLRHARLIMAIRQRRWRYETANGIWSMRLSAQTQYSSGRFV